MDENTKEVLMNEVQDLLEDMDVSQISATLQFTIFIAIGDVYQRYYKRIAANR